MPALYRLFLLLVSAKCGDDDVAPSAGNLIKAACQSEAFIVVRHGYPASGPQQSAYLESLRYREVAFRRAREGFASLLGDLHDLRHEWQREESSNFACQLLRQPGTLIVRQPARD